MATESEEESTRARAQVSATFDGPFGIGDLPFRGFTVDLLDYIYPFKIGHLLGAPKTEEEVKELDTMSQLEFFHSAMVLAWTLWAPIELVNDVALDIMDARTDEEERLADRRLRSEVLKFKSKIPLGDLPKLVSKIENVTTKIRENEFEVVDKTTDSDGERPPGN